jgi:hypothetical protein
MDELARLIEAGRKFADTVDQEQMRSVGGMLPPGKKYELRMASIEALGEFRKVLREVCDHPDRFMELRGGDWYHVCEACGQAEYKDGYDAGYLLGHYDALEV